MGSMWLDEDEAKQYPIDPNYKVLDFDDTSMTDARKFPKARWGSDFKAMLALVEFSATDWNTRIRIDPPNLPGRQKMQIELAVLVGYQQTDRQGALQEIIAQSDGFQSYLVAQLGISRRSYPHTYLLLKMAARIGEFVMVALKNQHQGVRPSQIYPLLFPPLDVPGHASYPSGHALVSHLMALTAIHIVPAMGTRPVDLADRIAKNREIAGLHFMSDSIAGKDAATQAFAIFKTLEWFKKTEALALEEWQAP